VITDQVLARVLASSSIVPSKHAHRDRERDERLVVKTERGFFERASMRSMGEDDDER